MDCVPGHPALLRIQNNLVLLSLVLTIAGVLFKFPTGYVVLLISPGAFFLGQNHREQGESPATDISAGTFITVTILLLLLAGLVRGYNLDGPGLRHDEGFIYQAALGYLETGEMIRLDPVREQLTEPYPRSALYTWFVAGVMEGWGRTPGVARWVSWLSGMGLILVAIWLARESQLNRWQTLVFLMLIVVSPHYTTLSRWIRMYGLFVVSFLVLTISLFKFATASPGKKRWGWGLLLLVSGGLSLHLHSLTLTILPGLLVFLLWEWRRLRSGVSSVLSPGRIRGFMGLLVVGLAGYLLLAMAGWVYPSSVSVLVDEFWGQGFIQPHYALYLFEENLGYLMGGLIAGIVLFTRDRHPFERYLLSVVVAATVAMVVFNPRLPQVRFMSHLMVLSWPLFLLAVTRIELSPKIVIQSSPVRPVVWILVGFIVIQPLVLFPARAEYIVEGNMGYVTFPGVESPRYQAAYDRGFERFGRDALYLTCDPWGHGLKPYLGEGYRARRISINDPLTEAQLRSFEDQSPVLILPSELPPCVDKQVYRRLQKHYQLHTDLAGGIDFYVYPRGEGTTSP